MLISCHLAFNSTWQLSQTRTGFLALDIWACLAEQSPQKIRPQLRQWCCKEMFSLQLCSFWWCYKILRPNTLQHQLVQSIIKTYIQRLTFMRIADVNSIWSQPSWWWERSFWHNAYSSPPRYHPPIFCQRTLRHQSADSGSHGQAPGINNITNITQLSP